MRKSCKAFAPQWRGLGVRDHRVHESFMRERRAERMAVISLGASLATLATVIVYTGLTWRLTQSATEELRPCLIVETIDFHTATTPTDLVQYILHVTNPGRVGVRFRMVSQTLKGVPMSVDPTTFVLFPGGHTSTVLSFPLTQKISATSFAGVKVYVKYEYAALGDDLTRSARYYEREFALLQSGDLNGVQTINENGN